MHVWQTPDSEFMNSFVPNEVAQAIIFRISDHWGLTVTTANGTTEFWTVIRKQIYFIARDNETDSGQFVLTERSRILALQTIIDVLMSTIMRKSVAEDGKRECRNGSYLVLVFLNCRVFLFSRPGRRPNSFLHVVANLTEIYPLKQSSKTAPQSSRIIWIVELALVWCLLTRTQSVLSHNR